jgi:hypothetical protein
MQGSLFSVLRDGRISKPDFSSSSGRQNVQHMSTVFHCRFVVATGRFHFFNEVTKNFLPVIDADGRLPFLVLRVPHPDVL